MVTFVEALFYIWVLLTVIFVISVIVVGRSIRKHVEEALKNATTEEQDIIRNKVVKAVFPPRFHRD